MTILGGGNPRHPKIAHPSGDATFPRKRLFQALDDAASLPLLWISAPAGAGKTALASSYLRAKGKPLLWYTIDGTDRDPAALFHYLRLAAEPFEVRGDTRLPTFRPENFGGMDAFSGEFFSVLFALTDEPLTVVFDDCHALPPGSPVHALLACGVAAAPPGGRIIALGREDPPPVLARLRAQRRMKCLDWDELRFTRQEMASVLTASGHELDQGRIDKLHDLTEGWIAAALLITEGSGRDIALRPSAAAHAKVGVFDLFASEYLARVDHALKDFLLKTSFLTEMTPAMAEAVSGHPGADNILAELRRRNFFIEQVGDVEPTYRFHPMFREYLADTARRDLDPGSLGAAQRIAAGLLVERGAAEDAVRMLVEAGEHAALLGLVKANAEDLLRQGRFSTLGAWIGELPAELTASDPLLNYWSGLCLLHQAPVDARLLLERALNIFSAHGDVEGEFLAWASIVNSYLYEWNDFRPLDRWLDWLRERLGEHGGLLGGELGARVSTSMTAALMIRRPGGADTEAWIERTLDLARESLEPNVRMHALTYAVTFFYWTGNLDKGRAVLEEARGLADSPEASPLTVQTWKWFDASVDICVLAEAERGLSKVEDLFEFGRRKGLHVWDHMLFALGMYASLLVGDRNRAERYDREWRVILELSRNHMHCHYHYLQCLLAHMERDFDKALAHAETALRVATETGYVFAELLSQLAKVRVLLALGRREEAKILLTAALAGSRDARSRAFEFASLLLAARLELDGSGEGESGQALGQALALGREHGLFHLLWWWDEEEMAGLCARALRLGIEPEYVRELVRRRGLRLPADADVPEWPMPVHVRTFGGFELRVNGERVRFSGKVQKRPLDLLQALIACGGRDVGQERLCDCLWPDSEGDQARTALATTLHRLRRLLGRAEAITLNGGRLSVNTAICKVDALAFEQTASRALMLLERSDRESLAEGRRLAENALGFDIGAFLARSEEQPWILAARARLSQLGERLNKAASGKRS